MFNIFEMMQAGQGHAGLDGLARQFGISQEQAARAASALLPAVLLGLQRSATDPNAFANLTRAFTAGPFASFFQNPAQPFPPQANRQAEQALGQVFGSADLTRQVAEQAATWSGVSANTIQQMMPLMTAAVVGSLSQFSDMMRAHASAAGGAPTPPPSPALAQPLAAWMEMMRLKMGGQPGEPPKPAPQPAAIPANPWLHMMQAMMGQQPPEAPPPEPQPEPEPSPSKDRQDGWADAIKTGREAQQQYIASLQNLFDSFWAAGPGRR